jgi:uncharacterized protein
VIRLDRPDTAKLDRARELVRGLRSALIAYSGGVDSTLLLRLALDELGGRAIAALAESPAFPAGETARARDLAESMGARVVTVQTHEMERVDYLRNQPDRCFHCREELFSVLDPLRRELGFAHIAYGANADDAHDHRPGHGSAVRRGVRFPLLEAGLDKVEIRAAARALGLPNWSKPSLACLSSRIPHGTAVTSEALRRIERAEAGVLALGFRQVRVRDHGEVARVEVDEDEIGRLLDLRVDVAAAVRAAGYAFVAVDLEGYETGRLNRTWKPGRP